MEPTSARATRISRQTAIDLPQASRNTRRVPCRQCVAAMMMVTSPAHRAADTCRNFMVSCTDRRRLPDTLRNLQHRPLSRCLECHAGGRTCDPPVHPSRRTLVRDLQAKYLAAFGKAEGSPEHVAWRAAVKACHDADGNVLPGIRRLRAREVEVLETDGQVGEGQHRTTQQSAAEWWASHGLTPP